MVLDLELIRLCIITFSGGFGMALIVKAFMDDYLDYSIMGVLALLIAFSNCL